MSSGILASLKRWFGGGVSLNQLVQQEVRATRGLFASQKGHEYDFFYYGRVDDEGHEWIFHDRFKDKGQSRVVTTRYIVYPDRVYRTREGEPYQQISGAELDRFYQAVKRYHENVAHQVYQQ